MTTSDLAVLVMVIAFAGLVITYIGSIFQRAKLIKQRNEYATAYEAAIDQLTERYTTAHDFVNAARIIDISQSGRSIYITVTRGDNTFIIESYAAMSTDLPALRTQCGLTKTMGE